MNIDLTPEFERLVQNKVKSGQYSSTNDVVLDALRLLEQRDEVFAFPKEQLRTQIEEGWRAAQAGNLADGDEVFDRIDAELEAMDLASKK